MLDARMAQLTDEEITIAVVEEMERHRVSIEVLRNAGISSAEIMQGLLEKIMKLDKEVELLRLELANQTYCLHVRVGDDDDDEPEEKETRRMLS